ncbi:MAG: hypothetical protein K6U02_05225 [Firmicutes bacterium]|nr:hypothetical protein [Bacillota bacterium]
MPVHRLYGLAVRCQWPLPWPDAEGEPFASVEVGAGAPEIFLEGAERVRSSPRPDDWFHCVRLSQGDTYLRWAGLFEFVVSSDGRSIRGQPLAEATLESFHTYLFGQALSFALLRQGVEPLHATVVVVRGEAVAFMADPGCGKSTLAAAFLQAGFPLLTDDLLVVRREGEGWVVYPGPARLKLFPEMARALLGLETGGTPLNSGTPKLILPLGEGQWHRCPAPLRAIYVLDAVRNAKRARRIRIQKLAPSRGLVELLRGTFNAVITDPERLRQQFQQTTEIARVVAIKRLCYPLGLQHLPAVREAVLADLAR